MIPTPSGPGQDGGDLVDAAHVAALAALPGMGPASLVAILGEYGSPTVAWAEVRAGRIVRPPVRRGSPPTGAPGLFETTASGVATDRGPRRGWADVARRLDPVAWWRPHARAGTGVTWLGRPDFPASLTTDPRPPGALFWRGRADALTTLDGPCVAVVGTRNATPNGRAVAFEMGRDLVAAGVCVVSGLALGIDGAAHAGALAAIREGATATTVGIAASGPDVPYPRRHARLWRDVTEHGAILSENVPGRPAQAWRFPTRNRIIAGLVALVVVVESHCRGGSLITAEAALERGVEVRVVPGPVHSPASEGSNQLLYDGPGPVRHAQDVLDALGMFRSDRAAGSRGAGHRLASGTSRDPTRRGPPAPALAAGRDRTAPPAGGADPVLEALGWQPCSMGQIMARTGLDSAAVVRLLDALIESGHVREEAGWWSRCR